jgi:sporulation protein YlmC with PRC-barrel domain
MKSSKLFLLTAGMAAHLAATAVAQQNQPNRPIDPNQPIQSQPGQKILGQDQGTTLHVGRTLQPMKATDVIGKDLQNHQRKDVGKVRDLLLDLPQGRIAGVVVGLGGVLGVGEQTRVVPPQSIRHDPGETDLMLSMDEKLRASKIKPADLTSYHQLGQVYSEFEQAPYWEGEGQIRQPVRDREGTAQQFRLRQATELKGANVKNHENKQIGEIEDFVVDLKSGRVLYATVSAGGFLGVGERIVAVPPRQFGMNPEGKLSLNTTEERLQNAPQFERSKWPELNDPAFLSRVYGFYGEKMDWAVDPASKLPEPDRPTPIPDKQEKR